MAAIKTRLFTNPTAQNIAEFLIGIGINVRNEEFQEQTFLPAIRIEYGDLVVDESRLAYPGDILHEAGHLAVVPPERRREIYINAGDDPAEEMMAIAWSWAAAVHIGIEPHILFHEGGYRGGSESLIQNFTDGRFIAVPMLQWIGLTYDPAQAERNGIDPYPHMVRWLRK